MANVDFHKSFDCGPNSIDQEFVFVIMPFTPDLTNIFNTIIKGTVESRGLRCQRTDDFKTNNDIMKDIVDGICKARFLIADITGYNHNVMYELGIAHALHKEVIMVYQKDRNGESEKFPFDISHIKSITYEDDAIGGQDLKNSLAATIDYVMSKAIPQVTNKYQTDNTFHEDTQDMILAQHELRRNRIEYFTFHCLHNFVHFRKQHLVLSEKIEGLRDNRQEQDIRYIQSIAKINSEFATGHLKSFTMYLLNNTSNFIDSGWLVNKFPDELEIMADAMNYVNSSEIKTNSPSSVLSEALDKIKYRIGRINFCIEAMEEERKKVRLPTLEYRE